MTSARYTLTEYVQSVIRELEAHNLRLAHRDEPGQWWRSADGSPHWVTEAEPVPDTVRST